MPVDSTLGHVGKACTNKVAQLSSSSRQCIGLLHCALEQQRPEAIQAAAKLSGGGSTFKKNRFVTPSRRGKELVLFGSCWDARCAKSGSWIVKYGLKSAE